MKLWRFPESRDVFDALVSAYSKRNRHYHTLEHLDACLKNLDCCSDQADHPPEVELALWFHDAIYQPLSSENESKSADWAVSLMQGNAASSDQIYRVRKLIMATRHESEPDTKDESIMLDIDLAILGADAKTYDAFENGVRREYRLVPAVVFRKKRVELLRGFLERPRIYQNEPFYSRLEARARENLSNAISRLSGVTS